MHDPRIDDLADLLVGYSCDLQRGEKILIEAIDTPSELVRSLIRRVDRAGGVPFVWQRSNQIIRDLLLVASEAQMRLLGEVDAALMREMDAYVGIRGNPNVSEWSDVPTDKMTLYQRHAWVPVHRDIRVPHTKWVVLRWPNPSMAQLANTSTEDFEDFYFRVCTLDYAKMSRAMEPLVELMNGTDRVRLVASGTDLSFSIRDIPAIPCDGRNNIPDGEVFTAPIRDSVEGVIQYNTPSIYHGITYEDVRFRFERGRIVEASASDTRSLEQVLDSDEGARYIGEFAIGFNPHVTEPMKDILFDEKIAGSIHLTPGSCYEEASNGNESQIHWDLVLRMTPDLGGGEIYFDEQLVRKDGIFVHPDLEALNPENLIG
ncbi:MAG: aminopeptidase [Thermoanaerobaculia bacterium]|nr:aminopeptidase [Thermoanaerobaculia bacterium]